MTLKQYILLSQLEYATTSFFPGFVGILYTWYNYETFRLGFSLLGLLTVVLFQLAISLRDNYLDFYIADNKNADYTQEMVLGKENIPLKNVRLAYYITGAIALIIGLFLVFQTSFFLLYIVLGGMLIGILYTFGPLPISNTPFGEFFIGLAYGLGIFTAMVYVNAFDVVQFDLLTIVQLIVASIPTAITVMSVSLANNICDLEEDMEDGRFTLPYHIGIDKALVVFKSFYYAGYIAIILSIIFGYENIAMYEWIIPIYQELGGSLFSIGSDAHEATSHYMKFGELIDLLEKFDIENVAQFYKQELSLYSVKELKKIF